MFNQKEYRLKNKEKYDKYQKEYKRKWHIKNRDKVIEKVKKWRQDNPERYAEVHRSQIERYRIKYPERIKAYNYANSHKQKKPFCLLHILTGQYIASVDFHHTDYEANLGFSVCKEHHMIVDKWRGD